MRAKTVASAAILVLVVMACSEVASTPKPTPTPISQKAFSPFSLHVDLDARDIGKYVIVID